MANAFVGLASNLSTKCLYVWLSRDRDFKELFTNSQISESGHGKLI